MVALADRKRVTTELKSWLDDVASYESTFKPWQTRTERIIDRYRGPKVGDTGAKPTQFNILWSNVQTLVPATFSKLPQPVVSRRFRDNDPVGRVASLIVERALEYEIEHYPFYRKTLKAAVFDRFIGGRGTCWIRYEPHTSPQDQITEGVEEVEEKIDYECTPVDYVHWRDFGHTVARTWEEVPRVWRKVYMRKQAIIDRFGEEVASAVPMDATPEDLKRQDGYKPEPNTECACIYEGWDKDSGLAVWFNKGVKDFLDVKEDPLELEQFFPCPPPLYATTTNESLVPVPDFALYQDQANELDTLAQRIDGLITALKISGVYDASVPSLARLFTEGGNNDLLPVKNWMAFSEKNGLKGAIDVVDLDPIARALKESYIAFAQVINFIYQITGIADIVRGQSDPNETLGAQEIKKNFVGLRLGDMKQSVALYATEILQIMAEIICTHYQPETLVQMSAADQLSPQDQVHIPAALEMLKNEPLRNFRIEVAADSLVQIDEQKEKENRAEFLMAVGGFMSKLIEAMAAIPANVAAILVPMFMELLKFGVIGFKVGKGVEGAIDEAADKLKALAQQPPPPPAPDPTIAVEEMKIKAQREREQESLMADKEKHSLQLQADRDKHAQTLQADRENTQVKVNADREVRMHQIQTDAVSNELANRRKTAVDQKKIDGDRETKNAEIGAKAATEQQAQAQAQQAQSKDQETNEALTNAMGEFAQAMKQFAEAQEELAAAMTAPKRVVRGPDGKASGLEVVR